MVVTEWDNSQKNIIHTQFEVNWAIEELLTVFETIESMVKEVNHPVIMVQDFSNSHYPPKRMIQAARNIHNKIPTNVVQIVIVGASPFLSTLLQLFQRIFPGIPSGVIFVETMEEARRAAAETLSDINNGSNSASA